jgi:hypothetical protein
VYTYFVARERAQSAVMLDTLLDEITSSPLQYVFEHSISLAIVSEGIGEGSSGSVYNYITRK